MGGPHPSLRAHGPSRLLHLIEEDLGETGDAWLTVAHKDTLTLLGDRLLVEYLMDELGSAKP